MTIVACAGSVTLYKTIPDGGFEEGVLFTSPVKVNLAFEPGTVTLSIDEAFDVLPYTCDLNCKQSGIIAERNQTITPSPPLETFLLYSSMRHSSFLPEG